MVHLAQWSACGVSESLGAHVKAEQAQQAQTPPQHESVLALQQEPVRFESFLQSVHRKPRRRRSPLARVRASALSPHTRQPFAGPHPFLRVMTVRVEATMPWRSFLIARWWPSKVFWRCRCQRAGALLGPSLGEQPVEDAQPPA